VIHDGEGEVGTGDVNRRPGCFRSLCCAAEVAVAQGDTFPACPRCAQPADWTWRAPLSLPSDAVTAAGQPPS
jgi:hypothetical protein